MATNAAKINTQLEVAYHFPCPIYLIERPDFLETVKEVSEEYLFKNLDIRVPVKNEKEAETEDWNIVCEGKLSIDRETSTAIIDK